MKLLKLQYAELYVMAIVSVAISLLLAMQLDFFSDIDSVALGSLDAKQYFEITHFLFGLTPSIDHYLLQLRPVLFPLYLGLYLVSPFLYAVVQLVLNMLTILLVYKTTLLMTSSRLLALSSTFFLLGSFTFLLIPFSAMTETLSIFLVAAAFFCMTKVLTNTINDKYLYWAVFLWSLLIVIKGIFLPFYMVWIIYTLWRLFRLSVMSKKSLLMIVLVFSPVLMQLGFTYTVLNKASISSAGEDNFNTRFFPFVYGVVEQGYPAHYRTEMAREAEKNYPDTLPKIMFLSGHLNELQAAVIFLVKDNFARGSTYIIRPDKPMLKNSFEEILWKTSIRIDLLTYELHKIILPVLLLMMVFDKKYRVFIATYTGFIASIILLSILTYNQGDRIVFVSMPAYAVLYVFVIFRLDGFAQYLMTSIRSRRNTH